VAEVQLLRVLQESFITYRRRSEKRGARMEGASSPSCQLPAPPHATPPPRRGGGLLYQSYTASSYTAAPVTFEHIIQ
jgi:hypothetical protein